MVGLDYDGLPEINKPRRLSDRIKFIDTGSKNKEIKEDKDKESSELFTSLGRAFLKGNILKKRIKEIQPKQFIPINSGQVAAAARRIDSSSSEDGTKIPFSMYTDIVDFLAEKQWEARRIYDLTSIPRDTESVSRFVESFKSGGIDTNIIKEFFAGSGLMGSILATMIISPFQMPGFQALTVEEATKLFFTSQAVVGVALMIELGMTSQQIKKALKSTGLSSDTVDSALDEMQNNENKRREALSSIGIDYDDLKKGSRFQDSITILNYVSEYIKSLPIEEETAYDHWIAYSNVVVRNNLIRSAFGDATKYSIKFQREFEPLPTPKPSNIINQQATNEPLILPNIIASHYTNLVDDSNSVYNSILNSLLYEIKDNDLCCLIEILPSIDTGILKAIRDLLLLLAASYRQNLIILQDLAIDLLSNFSYSVIYGLASNVKALVDNLFMKILKAFSEADQKILHLQKCNLFADIGAAIGLSIYEINNRVQEFLGEVLLAVDKLSAERGTGWTVHAERKQLVTLAKVLQAVIEKLDLLQACKPTLSEKDFSSVRDTAAATIVNTMLDSPPPKIQMSDQEIQKYFPDLIPSTSKNLGVTFGVNLSKPKQGEEERSGGSAFDECDEATIQQIAKDISDIFSRALSGE